MIPDYIDEVERPNEETIAAMLEAERIAKDPNVKHYTRYDAGLCHRQTYFPENLPLTYAESARRIYDIFVYLLKCRSRISVHERECNDGRCNHTAKPRVYYLYTHAIA